MRHALALSTQRVYQSVAEGGFASTRAADYGYALSGRNAKRSRLEDGFARTLYA